MSNEEESAPGGAVDASVACPYLGLVDDADSHATYATDAHRCYRLPSPTRIAAGHQDAYCLGDTHVTCPVYTGESPERARPVAAGGQRPRSGAAPLPGARTTKPPAARPIREPAEGRLSPRPRQGGIPLPALTIGVLVLAAVVLGFAIWIQGIGGGDGDDISTSDSFQTQTALKTRQSGTPAAASPTGTRPAGTPAAGSPTAAVTGTVATTPGATRTTTGTAVAGRTYTVVSGDTCFGIAEKNNVTLDALLQANGLDEQKCTQLAVGQVLKLP